MDGAQVASTIIVTCLYLSERLEAGAVTMDELIAETVRPWKHLPLKQRAMGLACRAKGFHFDGQLHIMRMMEMATGEKCFLFLHQQYYEWRVRYE